MAGLAQIFQVTAIAGISAGCSCCGAQVLSVEGEAGQRLYLRLTPAHKAQLATWLAKGFPVQALRCQTCVQSESTSGNPQSAGSTPAAGQSTAPASRAASAASGE